MCTVFPPYGFSIFKSYVVHRTYVSALSAGNASVLSVEFLCVNKHWIENAVYNAAVYFIFVMPENYIAMFSTPEKEAALHTIHQAEAAIDKASHMIKNGKPFPHQILTLTSLMKNRQFRRRPVLAILHFVIHYFLKIIYVFLTMFLYLLKCPQSLIL